MMTPASAYRYINNLSIDVAMGAMVSLYLMSHVLSVTLLPQAYAILGLTVWLIYTTDHLLDARKTLGIASSERHRLHQHHFGKLMGGVVAVACINCLLVFSLRQPLFEAGLYLVPLVGFYITCCRWFYYVKELVASLLYSAGVVVPVLVFYNAPLPWAHAVLVGQFMLVVLINILIFAWFSYEQDVADNHKSLITLIGKGPSKQLIMILFTAVFLLNFISPEITLWPERILINGMALALFIILSCPRYFRMDDRFRRWGDAVFFLPILLVI